jgi:cyclic beta-1,2-glucan synthetase
VDAESRAVRLFTPPFEHTQMDPGYIRSYPPGVRENGGQYTHAATWLVVALARLGRADDAWRLFGMLNPVNHALDRTEADRYRVEPFVVAADVYSQGTLSGRGGWTWYTGSAGWLYRAAVEAILGMRRRGDMIELDPVIPSHWPGFQARLAIGEAIFDIRVTRGQGHETLLDGVKIEDGRVPIRPGTRAITRTIP